MDVDDPPNLQRFVDAQKGVFEAVCTELSIPVEKSPLCRSKIPHP